MAFMNINKILEKDFHILTKEDIQQIDAALKKRFFVEYERDDRSAIYAKTQTLMAYNSNKIEGSTLTPDQTASLFDTGVIYNNGETMYVSKDIEEMNGHFLMFNEMLKTLEQPLSEDIIKKFHYQLKAGVFEDRANGYAIGDYKRRPNMIGAGMETVQPKEVAAEMSKLIMAYRGEVVHDLESMARFHAHYEKIHPFQDGNGRTGRMVLFRECLYFDLIPVIIKDDTKLEYYRTLRMAQDRKEYVPLMRYFEGEQAKYYEVLQKFLYEYDEGDM